MEYWLRIADICIYVNADMPLNVDKPLSDFLEKEINAKPSVTIYIKEYTGQSISDREHVGSDLLMNYYRFHDKWYCEADGKYGPVVRVTYTEDFTEVIYEVNRGKYLGSIISLNKIMQLFPMRQMLFRYDTFLLHSSQISDGESGILFSGESGIGKTTQAKLWEKYKHTEILCNDRTVLKLQDGKWLTYGFPVDGSRPICSKEKRILKAIVVLEQSKTNEVERLCGKNAIIPLMQQMIIDGWNKEMTYKVMEYLVELVKTIPIYRLKCTPDEVAILCLNEQLKKDGLWNV